MKPPFILPQYADLKKSYDAVVQCNRCGFCETVCPTYMASGKETLSPRGRNQAFRQILEGKIADPKQASQIFSTCLTCHACTNVCFAEVPVARLMAQAKEVAARENRGAAAGKMILRFFLTHRWLFSCVVWTAFFFKRIRFSQFLKRIGILKGISPELDSAEELIETVPLRFGSSRKPRGLEKNTETTAYFSGCGVHYLYPNIVKSCLKIADRSGFNINTSGHACCGLIASSAGDVKGAKLLAKKNIEHFSRMGTGRVLVDDDSCCGFMQSYGDLLEGDLKAVEFSSHVQNFSGFLNSKNFPWERLKINKSRLENYEGKLTYHDPCQMGNAHLQVQAPREILRKLTGDRFVEMKESNWCCGGAGAYCLKHPRLSDDILERKLSHVQECGARTVVTQASSCILHVNYGIRKKGWDSKVQVLHLSEFISEFF